MDAELKRSPRGKKKLQYRLGLIFLGLVVGAFNVYFLIRSRE